MVLMCKGDIYDSPNQEHCHLNTQSSSGLGHARPEKNPAQVNHDKLWSFRQRSVGERCCSGCIWHVDRHDDSAHGREFRTLPFFPTRKGRDRREIVTRQCIWTMQVEGRSTPPTKQGSISLPAPVRLWELLNASGCTTHAFSRPWASRWAAWEASVLLPGRPPFG
jgi:hypothetical protein